MRRVRLLVRLLGQVSVGIRLATRQGLRTPEYRRHVSLVEALHRDLGHRHDPTAVLPEHRGRL
jgi:hypothetical protein